MIVYICVYYVRPDSAASAHGRTGNSSSGKIRRRRRRGGVYRMNERLEELGYGLNATQPRQTSQTPPPHFLVFFGFNRRTIELLAVLQKMIAHACQSANGSSNKMITPATKHFIYTRPPLPTTTQSARTAHSSSLTRTRRRLRDTTTQ